MGNNRITWNVGFNVDKSQLKEVNKELQALQKLTMGQLLELKPTLNLQEAEQALKDIREDAIKLEQAFGKAFNPQLGSINLKTLNTELGKIKSDLPGINKHLANTGIVGNQAFQQMASAIMGTKLQLKESNKLLDDMSKTMGNTIKWGITSRIFNGITESVQEAWDYTKRLDASLNDIRIVTGKSADEMERFARVANKAAQNLGKSTKDYTDASLIYYQQGLTDEEVETRTNITLKTASVTGQSTDTVSEQLTAVWNGYQVAIEDSEKYIDKLAAVAATTASDLEELSVGMSKVASAANIMGVDVDQLSATLSTVISVTRQAPETVGTAFKTIFARMGDINAGIDSETTLDKYTKDMLDIGGISVLDANNELRNMGEVIEEVGKKWSTMSREQQIALSQVMAGTRQYNNLLSLFDNWNMYEKALDTSKNSLGYLNKQQDIYMERTTAHLHQMEAAWERVFDSFVDNEAINGFIDILTAITNGFANLTEAIGGGGASLLTFGSIASKILSKNMSQGIVTFAKNQNADKNNAQKIDGKISALDKLYQASGDKGVKARLDNLQYLKENMKGLNVEQIETFTEMIENIGKATSEMDRLNKKIDQAKLFLENLYGAVERDDISENAYADYLNNIANQEDTVTFENMLKSQENLIKAKKGQLNSMNDREAKYMSSAGDDHSIGMKNLFADYQKMYAATLDENPDIIIGEAFKTKLESNKLNIIKEIEDIISKDEIKKALADADAAGKGKTESARKQIATKAKKRALQDFGVNTENFGEVYDTLGKEYGREFQHKFEQYVLSLMRDGKNIINDALNENSRQIENIKEIKKEGGADYQQTKREIDTENAEKDLKNKWEEIDTTEAVESVLNLANSFGMLTSSVSSFVNIKNIFNNQDLSTGEKFVQIIMALTSGFSMGIMGLIDLNNGLQTLKKALKAYGMEALTLKIRNNLVKEGIALDQAEVISKNLAKKATQNSTKAIWAEVAAMAAKKALMLGGVLLAIGAVAAATYGLVSAYNADADAAKKAQERAKELSDAYQEVKTATEEFQSTLKGYEEIIENIQKLDKSTNEYKQSILEANEQALKLLETNKELAKYAERDEDTGLITFKKEGLELIEKQQLTELSKAQLNSIQANLRADKAEQKSNITNFKRDYKGASDEIIKNIADYMSQNNLTKLIPDDLDKIQGIGNASDQVQQSILDNIDAYSQMGTQLNDTKAKQKLLAKECNAAYLELHGNRTQDDNNPTQQQQNEVTEHLFNQSGGTEVSDQEKLDYIQNMDGNIAIGNKTIVSNEYSDQVKKWYAEKYGFDEMKQTFWDWIAIGSPYHGYKDGKATDTKVEFDDMSSEYEEYLISEERRKEAEKQAIPLVDSIHNFLQKESLNGLNDYDTVLNKLLISGESGKFTANSTIMTQDQAKILMSNFDIIAEQLKSSDFWTHQGFDEEGIINKLREWLDNRQQQSDVSVLGTEKINSLNSKSDTVVEQALAGELTARVQTDEYKALQNQLLEIKDLYPELTNEIETFNTTGMIGTQEWFQSLYEIQEKINELKLDSLNEEFESASKEIEDLFDKYKDEDGNIDIEAALNDDDFQEKMKDLMNKDYAINVEIHAQAEDAFETFETATKNMVEQAAKIGENYVVAAEDIRALNNAFPGIINGMEDVKDGSVKLKESVVKSAMEAAKGEMQASATSTLDNLTKQAKILRAKQETYRTMGNAAMALAKHEGNVEENKSKVTEGFQKLKDLNSEATANKEKEREEQVATNSNENASILAKNWSSAYESAANSAIAFAHTAVSAHKVAVEGKGEVQKGDFSVTYQGDNGKSSEAAGLAELEETANAAASDEDWEELANQFFNAADIAGRGANDIEGMIAQIGATTVENYKGLDDIAKGKGKDKSSKDPDKIDRITEEADIYHKVNTQLEKIDNNLSLIQSQEKKLTGSKLIANLNAQLGQLNKRLDQLREKMKIAQGETEKLRNSLSGQGVQFNPDGTISNYMEIYQAKVDYVNSLIDRYNAMSAEEQKNYKEVVEKAKKDLEQFTKDLDRYDELISDFIPGLEQEIQDAIDEQIELNIKKFNIEFEVRLDMEEAEKDWNEFKKKILDGVKDDDIYGNAKARATDDLSVYLREDGGALDNSTKRTNEILAELKEMDETGWSDVYGDDRASALEDLKEAYSAVMEDLMEIDQIQKDVHQAWLDTMDDINDKMADQVSMYEQISNIIEHDMKVIQLVYGEDNYEALGKYYEKQHQNNLGLLEAQRMNADFWEKEMNSIDKDKDPDAWKKARDNWISAVNDLNATIEASIENAKAKMENAIDETFDKLNDEITNGKGLDYLQQQWDLVNDVADDYLDTVNAAFGIRQLENKYQDAIDNTDNVSAQRKLNQLMQDELKALREKDKLTEYDIERANMKYEIAMKQLALEEAQQTKTSMRLRRDSQGNYRYEYVADEDALSKLQDELDQLENSLYNFDKDRWIEMQNQVVDAVRERQEAIKEILMDASLSEEERAERLAEINQLYNEKIQNITDQTVTAQENLYQSGSDEIAKIWDEQGKDFQALSDEEKRILVEEMLPQFDTGVNDMIEKFSGEGGFEEITVGSMEELSRATQDYKTDLEDIETASGTSFDAIEDGLDKNIPKTQQLVQDNQDLNDEYVDQIENIKELNRQLDIQIAKYKALTTASNEAAQAGHNYYMQQKQQEADAAAAEKSGNGSGSGSSSNNANSNGNGEAGSGSGSSGSGDGNPRVGDTATLESWGQYYYDSYGAKPNDNKYAGVTGGVIIDSKSSKKYGGQASKTGDYDVHIKSADGKYGDLGWVHLKDLTGYDTGGYTGDWVGNYGKLALLHNKELVLNENDTKNMLSMMEIARSIVANAGPNIRAFSAGKIVNSGADQLEQNVHIEANFPNVEKASEIEDALNNLVQLASQRANRNRRG